MKREYKKKIDFKHNFREYLSFIKKHKIATIFLLFISLAVEALFVIDKFLFKRLIDDGEMFSRGNLPLDIFVTTLLIIGAIFIAVVIGRAVGRWVMEHVFIKFEMEIIKDLKNKYFNHIVRLSHEFHTTHKSGSLISRMNRGTGAIEGLTDTIFFQFAPLIIQLILVSISLALFTKSSVIILILTSAVFITYGIFIQKRQEHSKLEANFAHDYEKGFISDIMTNIDSVKYFGKEDIIKKKFETITEDTRKKQRKNYNFFRWFISMQLFFLGLGTFFLIYFPVKEFLAGQVTLGTLVFIYSLYGNIAGNLFGFVGGIRNFHRAMADFQELFEYGKIENDIKDKPGAKNLKIKEGSIEFRNMNFNYGKRKLFGSFNLKIKPNEKVALVGHSGCGKTTLVKLLNRFYDIDSGEILIDNKNIKNFKQESLRGETGIVPQECILFDDTIYNNIKFANPSATKEKIKKAIKFAQLDEIINNFPKKEQTIVGERGVKLSGGEKQRVSIARAILADKKILVLDEATSSLDSETESEIQKGLQKLLQGRTSLIIAHRLSTIMNADRIIVMKKGQIIQEGKHKDLIKVNGEYRKLWNLQKGGYLK